MSEQKPPIHIHIRDLRRERALTQEELADALGLSRQSINAMEAGRCLPSLPVALQIASYFSVPLTAVFGATEVGEVAQEQSRALIPWSPLREVQAALDGFIQENAITSPTVPPVNLSHNDHDVLVEIFLPGYRQDELTVEVGEDFLLVSGQGREREADDRHYLRREYVQRGFQRSLSLPAMVQSEQAEADMRHGVLSILIPKKPAEKPRTSQVIIRFGE